jgi:chaperonin cofactor prefoldin
MKRSAANLVTFPSHPSIAVRLLIVAALSSTSIAGAQSVPAGDLQERIRALSESIADVQAQINQSQHRLDQMRDQLDALQHAATPASTAPPSVPPASMSAAKLGDMQERQEMLDAQIATLQQAKVETDSKYPITISGMVLFNGFLNSSRVDMAATPTSALFNGGSLGASVRQSVLGIDARGPHLLGASSYADLRVDFDGDPGNSTGAYPGSYNTNATLLRLRTIHAGLDWKRTGAFFSLDHTILSPDMPTSLTAVAEPPLAWSGNLWAWNPQLGVSQEIRLPRNANFGIDAALIDVSDAPGTLLYRTNTANSPQASTAEQSRRPGAELRLSLMGPKRKEGAHFGLGGYFAPHISTAGNTFDAWAATIDARIAMGVHLDLSASAYRGQALGGLGGGQYKDFITGTSTAGQRFFEVLDNVGGWAQLKETVNERLQFNEAFGTDQDFAAQLRPYVGTSSAGYLDFARNHTITGNVIYSPSAYLLFSFEYRRLETAPASGGPWSSNIYGLGAAYKF